MSPEQKSIILFLFTSPLTNWCGIFKVSIPMIAFYLGIREDNMKSAFDAFLLKYKSLIDYDYETGEVALLNWAQMNWLNAQPNSMKTAERELQDVESQFLVKRMIENTKSATNKAYYITAMKRLQMEAINKAKETEMLNIPKNTMTTPNPLTINESPIIVIEREIVIEKDIVKSPDLTLPLDLGEPLLEDKKEQKKTNKEKETAAAVLAYLNERAMRQFPTEGKRADNNLKIIIARLRDGFTEEELKKVIDCKVSKWLDEPKMKDYLKPSTLFRPGHCADYLEEANREGTITKTSNGLVFDIDLNGQTEQYKAWWDAIKEKYPNTANEVRFFSASEFLAYQKREWFPEFDNSVGQAAQKTRTQMCLSELESSHELRRKKKSLYSALTSFHLEKCGIYEHD